MLNMFLFFLHGSIILIAALTSTFSSTLMEQWEHVPGYNDLDFTSYTRWNNQFKSLSLCATSCARERKCISFTWNQDNLLCKTFSKIFYAQPSVFLTGNRYFIRKDYCVSKGYYKTPMLPYIPVCFKYVAKPLNFTSAIASCEKTSGILMRILNLETILHVGLYLRHISAHDDVWIDGNDAEVMDDWKYIDGSDVTYLRWDFFEPSKFKNGKPEDCLSLQDKINVLNIPLFDVMNDKVCDELFPYLCQLDIYA